jgi:hypothetical protein
MVNHPLRIAYRAFWRDVAILDIFSHLSFSTATGQCAHRGDTGSWSGVVCRQPFRYAPERPTTGKVRLPVIRSESRGLGIPGAVDCCFGDFPSPDAACKYEWVATTVFSPRTSFWDGWCRFMESQQFSVHFPYIRIECQLLRSEFPAHCRLYS